MLKLSKSQVVKRLNSVGFLLIDEYIDTNTKINVKCHCGNIFLVLPRDIFACKIKSCGRCNNPKIGQIFGKLTIIEVCINGSNGCSVKCLCECGNIWFGRASNLRKGTTSCGHCNDPKPGDKFGKLTVTKVIPSRYNGCSVECVCECGNVWKGYSTLIRSKSVSSCGCVVSKGELIIAEYLDSAGIQYIKQKTFKNCVYKNKLRFDFYLPKYNLCIEFNGIQHYRAEFFGDRTNLTKVIKYYDDIKIRDNIKQNFCQQNKMQLIIIKYNQINHIESILQSKLQNRLTNDS